MGVVMLSPLLLVVLVFYQLAVACSQWARRVSRAIFGLILVEGAVPGAGTALARVLFTVLRRSIPAPAGDHTLRIGVRRWLRRMDFLRGHHCMAGRRGVGSP